MQKYQIVKEEQYSNHLTIYHAVSGQSPCKIHVYNLPMMLQEQQQLILKQSSLFMNCGYIQQQIDRFFYQDKLIIVYEHFPCLGGLYQYLRLSNVVLPENILFTIAKHSISALVTIHEQNLVVENISLQSIMQNTATKVFQLQFQQLLHPKPTSQAEIQNPQFAAPERFMGYIAQSNDVWSLGCVLYQLKHKKAAYSKLQLQKALNGEALEIFYDEGKFDQILQQMMNCDWEKRITAKELMQMIE
uniref:Kinase, NEK n=1 Tax=Trepomonas sp. PC1 TaxID=1076344 RepID=A0A146KAH0_9EUKA|eukprot:JAP92461.1 Kinase, NEK [Trepomonas sp. PC1]